MSKTLPQIHLLCSEDELRPAMCHIEILDGVATATNGYLIGRLHLSEYSSLDEVTIKRLSGKLIHRDAWKIMMDAETIAFDDESSDYLTYTKGGIEAKVLIKDQKELKFVNYQDLIKNIANAKYGHRSFVAFNPKWIELSRKLFSSDTLIIRFYDQEGMFVCFPGTDAKAFIGIMPIDYTAESATFDFMV